MNIILIGPPGVGKGTQASFIAEKYKVSYITTGNLLRAEASSNSALGKKISDIIVKGELVPDDIVEDLIKNELSNVGTGILFDGYPRNITQVHKLEEILSALDKSVDLVLNMRLEDDILIKRISGRFVCANCSAVYNQYFVKPIQNGICDHCQSTHFITRADDNEETIRKRLKIFHDQNSSIITFYQKRGVLVDISCDSGVNEISHKISAVIESLKVKI